MKRTFNIPKDDYHIIERNEKPIAFMKLIDEKINSLTSAW
jgi:hypothetical protein